MSHDEDHAMNTGEKLVYMANQIASFFASQPADAATGVAKHINDFWEPRMRRQFFEIAEAGELFRHW
jgi:formate dehydrogenase subunit delta